MFRSFLLILVLAGAAASQLWCAPPPSQLPGTITSRNNEPIKPIPLEVNLDSRKVALGKALFHEPKLSHDNTVACASCHDLSKGGTDNRMVSIGINGIRGEINSPTVFNSGANFKQFWDGRAATLEEQTDGPIHDPKEMGSSWAEVISKLGESASYKAQFKQIYPDGIQAKNIRDAIAQFERSLITPNSRFDKFLRGDDSALSAEEQEGYRKFKSYGCTNCHQGVNIGGNLFEAMGAMAGYFEDRGGTTKADLGRYNVTGDEEDRHVFKVPTLRNIALTAPYLHDGSANTLDEVVVLMARFQLGQHIPATDVENIVKFLKTLTGEFQGKPL